MRGKILAVLAVLPMWSWAQISGVYEIEGGQSLTLSYKDDQHMRMEMQKDQFMLVNDDKVYMVHKQGGQWTAMDMSKMGEMMKRMGQQAGQQAAEQAKEQGEPEFNDTGRTETVAGYEGKVYDVVSPDGERNEMVLSKDDDIIALSRAMAQISGKMVKSMGMMDQQAFEDAISESEVEDMGGMLRVGDEMRLKSVSTDDKGDDHFELPEGTKIQDMSGMMGR